MSALAPRFDELRSLLEGAERVIVAGHERADGDSVGAVSSLRRHLELENRPVTALLCEPLSPRYAFMEFHRRHEVWDAAKHADLLQSADVFIMCDLSSYSRLGPLAEPLARSSARKVCIDHHPCEEGGPADINLLDPGATATGRIVWDYIRHVGGRVDREIAEGVFVSICTDTGWFRYSNTDAAVLQLAVELASHGLDLPGIHREIYQSFDPALLRLIGHVTRSLHAECEGRFIWAVVRHDLVRDLRVPRVEIDPLLDVLRSAGSVRIVALFTEQADGSFLVSLRSNGNPDVNRIARGWGGGGHAHAAGASLAASRAEDSLRALVGELRRAVPGD